MNSIFTCSKCNCLIDSNGNCVCENEPFVSVIYTQNALEEYWYTEWFPQIQEPFQITLSDYLASFDKNKYILMETHKSQITISTQQ